MMNIIPERLAELEQLAIHSGAHNSFEEGHCAMELVAWLAGEPHSDKPLCTCPVIGAYVRRWNDRLESDEERRRLLGPLLPLLAYLAVDWSVRTALPLLLAALERGDDAKRLRELAPIIDRATAEEARIGAARSRLARAAPPPEPEPDIDPDDRSADPEGT